MAHENADDPRRAPERTARRATGPAARAEGEAGLPHPDAVPRPWSASYPPNVPASYTYPEVPLTRLLDDAVVDFPRNEAVHCLGASTSYRELLDEVDRFASALAALGVAKGQRVGLALPNCPQHVVAVFAVLRLGAVVVEIDALAPEDELVRQIGEAGCRVLVCLDPVYPRVVTIASRIPTVERVIVTGLQDVLPFPKNRLFALRGRRDGTYHRIPDDAPVLRMSELIEQTVPAPPPVEVDPAGDPALVLRTSGATGASNGVVLTHANVVANAVQARLWIPDVRAGAETVLCVVPFCHPHGMITGLALGVLSAAELTLVPRPDVETVPEILERRRPTLLPGLPTTFAALTRSPRWGQHDVSSLRVALSVGAPLAEDTVTAFEGATGARLREGYGLAEAGALTHANPVYGRSQPGSIGLPLPDTMCTLRDVADPRRPAPEGGPGQLAVAGPQVMAGYDGRPDATAAALMDGWLLTGDIATVDEDGYFTLVDRMAALIRVGSATVQPREVEAALAEHPAVSRAAVVGAADEQAGQKIEAHVVLDAGADVTDDELLSFVGQRLAPHKLPRRIQFCDTLPQNLAGEVLRVRLAASQQRVDG